MMTQLTPTTSTGYLIVSLGLRGFAMGFAMMPSMSAALARIDRRFTSRASSITNTLQRVSTALGVAILVTFLSGQFTAASSQANCNPTQAVVSESHVPSAAALCSGIAQQIQNVSSGKAAPPATQPTGALGAFAKSYASDTLSIAYDRTFFFVTILSAMALIPALFLRKPEHQAEPGARAELGAA
jgi:hypothetical protein